MAQPLVPRMTEAEYLALERSSSDKHEYIDGFRVPIAGGAVGMAGASPNHNLLVGNLVTALNLALRDRPCAVYPSDMRVKVESTGRYYYPDVSVACDPRFSDGDSLLTPEVLVEVLSRSTEDHDRGHKFDAYRRIPTLRDYLLCSSTKASVEHYSREPDGSWHFREYDLKDRIVLGALGIELAVDELYRKLTFD